MVKHITLLAICFIGVALLCSSCGSGRTHKEQTEEMLAHMYEKYGVEFQIDWESQTVTGDYDSYNLSIKGNTDEALRGKVSVEYWFNSDNPYRDNYFLQLTELVIQERVEKALGDAFLYKLDVYSDFDVDNKYCSVDQLDEYLAERGESFTGHDIYLIVQDQGSEDANIQFEQELKETLKGAKIGNAFLLLVCFKEEDYTAVDTSTSLYGLTDVYTYRNSGDLYD